MTLHRIVRKFIMSLIAMHALMGKASRFSAQQLRRSGLGSHRVGASTFLQTVSDIQEVAERGIWTSKSELESGRLHADEDVTYPFDTRVGRTMASLAKCRAWLLFFFVHFQLPRHSWWRSLRSAAELRRKSQRTEAKAHRSSYAREQQSFLRPH